MHAHTQTHTNTHTHAHTNTHALTYACIWVCVSLSAQHLRAPMHTQSNAQLLVTLQVGGTRIATIESAASFDL